MRDSRVLVIGGGFAGIAAASRLRMHGARVMLIDDRDSLGGRARSDVLDGWTVDVGAQLLSTSYTRTLALLRDGAEARTSLLHRVPGRDVFLRDGAAYPITFGSLRSMLAFGAIGATDKVRLGMQLVPLLARHRDALRADGERIPQTIDRESASAFMRRAVSRQAADALVEPVTATFCGAHGDDVSLAFYLTLGHYGSEGAVLAPGHGWSALLDAAMSGIEIAHGARAVAIELSAHGIVVRSEDGRSWDGESAVLATDAHTAERLLEGIAEPDLTGWLRGVTYRPSITVAATITVPLPREAFGLLVHNDGRWPVSALAVHGAKAAGDTSAGDVLLAWPTPDAADRLIDRSPAEIAGEIMPAMEALVPRITGRVGRVRVYRHPLGTPLPSPGFTADRAAGRALAQRLAAPIALAGDYLTMPLIEGAVASGEAAAAWLRARMG